MKSKEMTPVSTKDDSNDIEVKTLDLEAVGQNKQQNDSKEGQQQQQQQIALSILFSKAESLDYFFMAVGTIGAIITGLSIPFFNVLFGRLLDKLNGNTTSKSQYESEIDQIVIVFCITAAINLFTGYCQVCLWSLTGERQTQKLREAYVRSVLSQEVGWFDTIGASELATKVADIVGKIEDGIGRKLGDMLQYISQLIGSFVVGFYLCWRLTVVLLACFPLIAFSGAFMISAISAALQQSLSQYAKAGGLATETLSAIRTVTALNAQVDAINRYRIFLLDAMQVGIRKGLNLGIGNGILFGACFCTYALGFWYGAKLIADDLQSNCSSNCLTGGTILAVFFSVIMGSMAMGQIAPPLTAFTQARAAAVPLFEVINRKPLIDGLSNEGHIPDIKIEGKIELKDIEFAYPSRPHIQVCKGYSLTIEPGETVALVGPSGCGKSTIINLLLRFYDPQQGSVRLDNVDIKTLNTRWLRSQMGYVGQEPVLFSGSIADNISYGIDKEILSISSSKMQSYNLREEIIAAAKLANAHEFIMSFPDGYETDVGSNGVALSGGQKQRLAIARALIRHPAVLLLDEATSALDATSERMVQESIDMLAQSKNQTTIIIAHRLSTIRNADKIAVINNGQVMELGKHEELLAMNGLYADLVKLQMTTGVDAEIIASSRNFGSNTNLEMESKDDPVEADDTEQEEEEEDAALSDPLSTFKNTVAIAITEPVIDADNTATDANHSLVKKKNATKPKEEEVSNDEAKDLNKKIWAMIMKSKTWFSVGIFGAAVFGAVFPVWGYILAQTQNILYLSSPDSIKLNAANLAYVYIALGFVSIASSTLQFWGIAQVGERISAKLRSDLFEALMRRDISFYDYEENSIGALTTRLADDSRIVTKATGEAVAKEIQAFFTLVVGIGFGFSASWKISLVVIAAFPLNIIASAIQMQAISGQQYDNDNTTAATPKPNKTNKSGTNNAKNTETVAKMSNEEDKTTKKEKNSNTQANGGHGGLISTAFTHMRTVSAFSMQFHVSDEYAMLTQAIANKRMERSHFAGFGFGGAQCSLFCTYALLFWYGSTLVVNGEITFVQLMTAILCLMLGALGLGQALNDLGDQKGGLLAAKRIFKEVEEGKKSPIDGLSDEGYVPTDRSKGYIELKNVDFKYPTRPKVKVCKKYNLTIEPGEVVALVGPSGSGKSTIMNLLLRFYDPISGEVLLDGRDIKSVNVKWLRSQIGYVGQEPVLFSGTIAENIAKGRAKLYQSEQSSLISLDEALERSVRETGMFGKSPNPTETNISTNNKSAAVITKDAISNHSQPDTQVFNSNRNENISYAQIYTNNNHHDNYNKEEEEVHDHNISNITTQAMMSKRDMIRFQSQREAKELNVDPDIVEAAKLSNAHDFIKTFPMGYHTDVGEGSIMVSGGQKQRIAIARALIRQPAVLLLDEATSALDAASEQLVQESIDMLQENKAQTTIVIAHRLSTIRNADKIAVINHGKVVELGKHEELLAMNGLYAQLWMKQGGESSSKMSRNTSNTNISHAIQKAG